MIITTTTTANLRCGACALSESRLQRNVVFLTIERRVIGQSDNVRFEVVVLVELHHKHQQHRVDDEYERNASWHHRVLHLPAEQNVDARFFIKYAYKNEHLNSAS